MEAAADREGRRRADREPPDTEIASAVPRPPGTVAAALVETVATRRPPRRRHQSTAPRRSLSSRELSASATAARFLVRLLVRRAGTSRADEQFLSVREGDVAPVRAERSILGLEAVDDDLDA